MSIKYFVLLSLLFVSVCLASDGDTLGEYRHCLDKCVQVTCPSPLDASLRLLHWNCKLHNKCFFSYIITLY